MANVPEEAKAALERLKTLIVPGSGGVDAAELIRLADLAASPITDTAARKSFRNRHENANRFAKARLVVTSRTTHWRKRPKL